jgi:hypothetical protein
MRVDRAHKKATSELADRCSESKDSLYTHLLSMTFNLNLLIEKNR